jgi:hypothetical protein
MERNRNARVAITVFIGLLLVVGLACAQAGEILTPAEATARAEEASGPARPASTPGAAGEGAAFEEGDTVEFIGQSHLVPLYRQPGDLAAFSFAGRGDPATVLAYEEIEGHGYYQVNSGAGQGWVPAENVVAAAGSEEGSVEPAGAGPQPGDKVGLTATSYLANLMDGPCSTHMIAVQERGVEVTILETAQCEDQTWYLIKAPTGEGWVPAENITTEAP